MTGLSTHTLDPVDSGKIDVHQNHVRRMLRQLLDRLLGVGELPHQLQIRSVLQP